MSFVNKTFKIFLDSFSINETKLNILISQTILISAPGIYVVPYYTGLRAGIQK